MPPNAEPSYRIDPTVYEASYRQKREQGWDGWFRGEGLDEVIRDLSARLEGLDLPGKRVLEVGCGAGDQALLLAERGFDVVGVDISETAVAWAREKAADRGLGTTFQTGDVRDLAAFEDDSFDWVLDGNCWHFIVGEGRAEFLRSVKRVLKPGGLFVANSLCGDPGDVAGVDREARVQIMNGVAVTYFAAYEELLQELADAGFTVEQHELLPGIPGQRNDFFKATARG